MPRRTGSSSTRLPLVSSFGGVGLTLDYVPSKGSPANNIKFMRAQLLKNIFDIVARPLSLEMQEYARGHYGWDDQPADEHNPDQGYFYDHASAQIIGTAHFDVSSDTVGVSLGHSRRTVQSRNGRDIFYGEVLEARRDKDGKELGILNPTMRHFEPRLAQLLEGAANGITFSGVTPARSPTKSAHTIVVRR